MKLISEINEQVKVLTEAVDSKNPSAGKNYFIEGIFLQCNKQNRNRRIYPLDVVKEEIERYNEGYVLKKRALGELGHPEGPTINLERVSHIITELKQSGDDYMGKAKIIETPYGKIVKGLIDEGVTLGVSTRGLGSLKEQDGADVVQSDFSLATVDIVADPSAPDAFVRGIMEGKEWVMQSGVLTEKTVDKVKKTMKNSSSRRLQEDQYRCFVQLLNELLRNV